MMHSRLSQPPIPRVSVPGDYQLSCLSACEHVIATKGKKEKRGGKKERKKKGDKSMCEKGAKIKQLCKVRYRR